MAAVVDLAVVLVGVVAGMAGADGTVNVDVWRKVLCPCVVTYWRILMTTATVPVIKMRHRNV